MAKFQTERYLHNTQVQSSYISGVLNAPTVSHTFAAATTVAAGDFLLIAKLPERTAIHGIELVCSATIAGLTVDVGTMNADETDIAAKFLTGVSIATAKWYKVGDNVIEGRLAKVHDDLTTIAVKFTTAGVIPKGAIINVTPIYRHANNDE